jgi:hypothetical protein
VFQKANSPITKDQHTPLALIDIYTIAVDYDTFSFNKYLMLLFHTIKQKFNKITYSLTYTDT